VLAAAVLVRPQTSQRRPAGNAPKANVPKPGVPKATPTPSIPVRPADAEPEPPETDQPSQDLETLKIDTNLVTVPVIATTVEGNYIPDLRQEEFSIAEDGVNQPVAFFAAVSAPFNVVLLLDTSASTEDKLASIRRAAATFVEQLQAADRVKIISFDNEVRELSDFTNNRTVLRSAINKTAAGTGTKLYDAFEVALSSIRRIQGRRAIVLFTDGVDWHSDQATFESSLRGLDEDGVIVYPIRFETREEAERIVREANSSPSLPTIDVVRGTSGPGSTAPTFPSDEPNSIPSSTPKTGPFGLPTAEEIMRGRRRRDNYPAPDQRPPGPTGRPDHDPAEVGAPRPDGGSSSRRSRRDDDSVSMMLDSLYSKADTYLLELAKKSGGRVVRADTLGSLPDAFAKIAAELRIQYAIGYYPANKTRDGEYRKIKVTTTRKNVVVRARPGYRAAKSY
jgi:uncharacterized protein YegL